MLRLITWQPRKFHKSADARKKIHEALDKSFLFKPLDKHQRETVIDCMEEKHVSAGDVVITEGENGDFLAVIDHGQFDVCKGFGDSMKKVFTYDNKGLFGELALMHNCPRAATIKVACICAMTVVLSWSWRWRWLQAAGKGLFYTLDQQSYTAIIIAATRVRREKYEKFVGGVSCSVRQPASQLSLSLSLSLCQSDCLQPI